MKHAGPLDNPTVDDDNSTVEKRELRCELRPAVAKNGDFGFVSCAGISELYQDKIRALTFRWFEIQLARMVAGFKHFLGKRHGSTAA